MSSKFYFIKIETILDCTKDKYFIQISEIKNSNIIN